MGLLGQARIGRLAVGGDPGPLIFPVNYTLSEGIIVIATAEGTKVHDAPLAHVAFEVDSIDQKTHEGWSVVVQGVANDITESIDAQSVRLRQLPLTVWAAGPHDHRLTVEPRIVTGRRLRPLA
jgi:nitroimidazol reductase NimA-like FMN-containing flavoprotein (pyridoxamine 5'-phosphate oxidase superfamily)